MSRRENFSTTKNPPRTVGTVFDAMKNVGWPGAARGRLKGGQRFAEKAREKRIAAALAVDFTKPYGKGA